MQSTKQDIVAVCIAKMRDIRQKHTARSATYGFK